MLKCVLGSNFSKLLRGLLLYFILCQIILCTFSFQGVCTNSVVVVPSVFYAFFLNLSLHLLLGSRLPPPLHSKLRTFALTALRFQTSVDPTTGVINMTPWVRHLIPEMSGYAACQESNRFIKAFIKVLCIVCWPLTLPFKLFEISERMTVN